MRLALANELGALVEAAKGPRGILSLDSSLLKDRGGHGF